MPELQAGEQLDLQSTDLVRTPERGVAARCRDGAAAVLGCGAREVLDGVSRQT
jgi:hypothetical protein